MQDIKEAISTTIRDDATVRTLTGYTSSDPRVYYAWQPRTYIINNLKPAYITFYIPTGSYDDWNREQEIYTINIYSENPNTNDSILKRLDKLLHNQILTDTQDNYITNSVRITQNDSYDDEQLVYIKSLNFQYTIVTHQELGGAVASDGGVFTDETIASNNDTIDDMTLLPSTPAVNDAYYFGYVEIFSKLYLSISTPGIGTWTMSWEYWNGASWTSLDNLTDGTSAFTNSGINSVSFTANNSWRKTDVAGIGNLFWIRGRVSTYNTITTQPLGKLGWT